MNTSTAACSASASIVAQATPSTVARFGDPGWKPTAQVVGAPRSEPCQLDARDLGADAHDARVVRRARRPGQRAEMHGLEQARLAGAVASDDREHLAAQRAVEPGVAAEVRGTDVLDAHLAAVRTPGGSA